jgi:hypothetical protein
MFRKAREVIEAFRWSAPPPTVEDEIEHYGRSLDERLHGGAEETASAVVLIGIVIPISIALGSLLAALAKAWKIGPPDGAGDADKYVSVFVGVILAYVIGHLHRRIVRWLPFHKLNPYFGSKIQETIRALKSP